MIFAQYRTALINVTNWKILSNQIQVQQNQIVSLIDSCFLSAISASQKVVAAQRQVEVVMPERSASAKPGRKAGEMKTAMRKLERHNKVQHSDPHISSPKYFAREKLFLGGGGCYQLLLPMFLRKLCRINITRCSSILGYICKPKSH